MALGESARGSGGDPPAPSAGTLLSHLKSRSQNSGFAVTGEVRGKRRTRQLL